MKTEVSAGDLVVNLAGKDKGRIFLVVKTEGGCAYIADGRKRKVTALKKKNPKHLTIAVKGALVSEAGRIADGKEFGNDRLYKLIARLQK